VSARSLAGLAIIAACGGDPHVLNGFNSPMGVNGLRARAHAGVDFPAEYGSPVLAATDGSATEYSTEGCGNGVMIISPINGTIYITKYCHLSEVEVPTLRPVLRGDEIGRVGTTGWSGGVPHVHLALCTPPCRGGADGDLRDLLDPMQFDAGCFDPHRDYPRDKLVLTHPIVCTGR